MSGFNSVYHITDLPSFISGKHIVYFDPQATNLPNINVNNPGKRIDFIAQKQLISVFSDQFGVFKAFGCDPLACKPFPATLFRFPLRTTDQAATSRLSSSVPNMEQLAQAFETEAPSCLLFLKNVET